MIRIMQKILEELQTTNQLLTKMEEHLKSLTLPPDLRQYKRKKLPGEEDG
tara:strand:+ start:836 stop:985 length:150 start_codon:yes stop_codon:yes gene_type:complete